MDLLDVCYIKWSVYYASFLFRFIIKIQRTFVTEYEITKGMSYNSEVEGCRSID